MKNTTRRQSHLLFSPFFWLGSFTAALTIAIGCSSSISTPAGCTAGQAVACTCASGQTGTELCGSSECVCDGTSDDSGAPAPGADAGESADAGDHNGDGGHVDDGATPGTLYSACAVQGSFGWTCTQPNAIDTINCTDPKFPYCFGGGQGYWCTADCADAGFTAACLAETGGCQPTACNAKGYCK
jgi:hypothetical protein